MAATTNCEKLWWPCGCNVLPSAESTRWKAEKKAGKELLIIEISNKPAELLASYTAEEIGEWMFPILLLLTILKLGHPNQFYITARTWLNKTVSSSRMLLEP